MALIQYVYQKKEKEHCTYNRDIFARLKKEFPDLEVKEIINDSPGGKKLVRQFNITVFPATIVDGKFYRSGGMDEEELRQMLGG